MYYVVSEKSPAILRNWRMYYGAFGPKLVEPAFADLDKAEGEECHGVAIKITKEGKEILDG